MVLVHGAPDRAKNFAHVVHRLPDLQVTVYDRRGYGWSVDAAVDADGSVIGGFDVHADDLIELLAGVPSVVVAQSAGGSIATLAATRAPELFLALGVWEPPMIPHRWWAWPTAFDHTASLARYDDPGQLAEDFNRQILGDERWHGLREGTRRQLVAEGSAFRADMACQLEPYVDLDLVKVPYLVGWGSETPPEFADANRELAQRTNAEVFVSHGADHFAHLSNPDVWVELVRRTVELAGR